MNYDRFTDSQKQAVDIKERNLLVSAAAGSGKSTVMTERIIRHLLSGSTTIDKMLIVTFTRDATNSLKNKVREALIENLSNDENGNIRKNITRLTNADICTIDSFYFNVVKENFALLGLSPGLRVLEETENTEILNQIMDETIEDFYKDSSKYDVTNFKEFVNNFIYDRDDSLTKELVDLYNKVSTKIEGIDFVQSNANDYYGVNEKNFFDTKWGKIIYDELEDAFTCASDCFKEVNEYISGFDDSESKTNEYKNEINMLFSLTSEILTALNEKNYKKVFNLLWKDLPKKVSRSQRSQLFIDVDPRFMYYDSIRDTFFDYINDRKYIKDVMSNPPKLVKEFANISNSFSNILYSILKEFDKRVKKKKNQMGVLSFNDCSRYTYELLVDEKGGLSDLAKKYSQKYDEIFIDEYQDTNELQDYIFSAISRDNNRFMVGDIKQSIYLFRDASPNLFIKYKKDWPVYSENDNEKSSTVYLSDNFRSSRNILDFSNLVCGELFTKLDRNINYTKNDDLIYGSQDNTDSTPVNVAYFERSKSKDIWGVLSDEQKKFLPNGERYILNEIKNLHDQNNVDYKNITVLVQKNKEVSEISKFLRKYDIPTVTNTDENLFEKPEILLLISVLQVVDNPNDDIFLASMLQSPLYNYSIEKLYNLKNSNKKCSIYKALCISEDDSDIQIIKSINEWREYSKSNTSDKLIHHLLDQYNFRNLILNSIEPDNREYADSNITSFYELARSFESSSFQGLYSFLSYITNTDKISVSAISNSKEKSAVKIMTIHKSKGLEFDYCFVYFPGSSGILNHGNLSNPSIYIDKELGISIDIKDTTNEFGLKYNSVFNSALKIKNENDEFEESIRLLYVAMTRAKFRLWIVGGIQDVGKTLDNVSYFTNNYKRTLYKDYGNDHYIKWILCALEGVKSESFNKVLIDQEKCFYSEEKIQIMNSDDSDSDANPENPKKAPSKESDIDDNTANENNIPDEIQLSDEDKNKIENIKTALQEKFEYKYPYEFSAKIPSKLVVTKLYPDILNKMDSDETAYLEETIDYLKQPKFTDNNAYDGAKKGTATHVFMQFCNFENVINNGIELEGERLVREDYMTQEMYDDISKDNLDKFFDSDLFKNEIMKSGRVLREQSFTVLLPASDFTTDSEIQATIKDDDLMIQGVIDCMYENPDGTITILDYKTDSVKDLSIEEAKQMLLERHSRQLGYYKKAIEKLTGKTVSQLLIYSFSLGDVIKVED